MRSDGILAFKYLLKLAFYALPICLVLMLPLVVAWQAREFLSLGRVIEIQSSDPKALFGLAYSYADGMYKRSLVDAKRPEVIALGSSRVMQFRQQMFSDSSTFVNAGGDVSRIEDMIAFVQTLPDGYEPRVIILGLDQNFLKPGNVPAQNQEQTDASTRMGAFLRGNWKKVYMDYFSGKFGLVALTESIRSSSSIGMSALTRGNGFRADGSYSYTSTEQDTNRLRRLESDVDIVRQEIFNNRGSFAYGTTTSPQRLAVLNELLTLCRQKEIHVVGFAPPYAPSIFRDMIAKKDEYSESVRKVPEEAGTVFRTNGYSFFDFSDAIDAGIGETEFVDATHPSDKAYARILLEMASKDAQLRLFVSENLRTLLKMPGDFLTAIWKG